MTLTSSDNVITLYDVNGFPVTFDFSEIIENQNTQIQQNVEILEKLNTQIEIENNTFQLVGFCFVLLAVSFLYRIFHSVMSF